MTTALDLFADIPTAGEKTHTENVIRSKSIYSKTASSQVKNRKQTCTYFLYQCCIEVKSSNKHGDGEVFVCRKESNFDLMWNFQHLRVLGMWMGVVLLLCRD